MALTPKQPDDVVRQIDTAATLRMLQRVSTGLFAVEMGIDPVRAVDFDWRGGFSVRNPFHVLAGDARALAVHTLVTGLDVPVVDMARALGLPKQVVSRLCHQGEDLQEGRLAHSVIRRMAQVHGVQL